MSRPVVVGVSLKMYFGHRQAREWFAEVAERVRGHRAVQDGDVLLFIIPTYLQIGPAVEAFTDTPVQIGAQDVATDDSGAFTGEVSAAELAEVGVVLAEIGHAERRRLFGETDAVVAAKAAAALRNGIRPGSIVIYGGSAGPGLLTELGDSVDGLFLGRFAHDPDALVRVLDEAAALAAAAPTPARLHPDSETAGDTRSLGAQLQSRGPDERTGA